MSIQTLRTKAPKADQVSTAIAIAQSLERRERSRVSSIKIARQRLAERLRIGTGTLENLVRGRIKRIDASVRDRLHVLMVRELESEIARLSHELEMARQCGSHPASLEICEVETHLAKARSLLVAGR